MAKKPNFGLERRERANAKAAKKAAKIEAKAAKTEQRKEAKEEVRKEEGDAPLAQERQDPH